MRRYSNTAVQTALSGPVTAAATSMSVSAVTGFPGTDFVLAIDYGTANQELVLVTAVSGTTLTVTRGYDNTTAVSHDTGAVVVHTHSAADFADSRNHEAATSNVHGVTGVLLGASDTAVLTNKDLTSGTNTFPAKLQNALSLTGSIVGSTDTEALTNKDLSDATNTMPAKLQTARSLAGDIVGTTDTQTLTHKDLSDATNALPANVLRNTDPRYLGVVKVATTGNVTLSGLGVFDGVTLAAGDLVLVKDQTTQSQNGVYVADSASWTRATWADAPGELAGLVVAVSHGTANGGKLYYSEFPSDGALATDPVVFSQAIRAKDIPFVQSGTISIALSAASTNTGAVTFPTPFVNSTVHVTATPNQQGIGVNQATSATSTGITLRVFTTDGSSTTKTVGVDWIAVGSM